jgi:hypothetical protein
MVKFCHHSMAATVINAIKTLATVNISSGQLNDCGTEINVILSIISGIESIVMLGTFNISTIYKNSSSSTPGYVNHLSQLVLTTQRINISELYV